LSGRLDPIAGWLQTIFDRVKNEPKRIIFAEGEQPQVARAANAFLNAGLGTPVLIGRESNIREGFAEAGIELTAAFERHDTSLDVNRETYAQFLYSRLQREGHLLRDCDRLVANDRNVHAACMLALGHADGIVTGVTRNWYTAYEDVRRVLDAKPGQRPIGVSLVLSRGRAVLIADASVHDMPTAIELADIAEAAAKAARRFGMEPRVALLAYSTFGHPRGERSEVARQAVRLLEERNVDFEFDGEMAADVALSREAMARYPFCKLKDTANVLVMPAFHSASIASKMLRELGGATLIGPLLVGLSHSVQICQLGAKDSDIVNMAALAAYDLDR
jgi:malate dehydrogenase (oxaloacetate-decarboxylating)(NADP+)